MSAEPIARERILDSAYELFSRRGIRAVGIKEVIERAGVAKATLYRHFPSKDELVLAFLEHARRALDARLVEAEAPARGSTPRSAYSRSSISSTSGSIATTSRRARSSTCCSRPPTSTTPSARASVDHLESIRDDARRLARKPASATRSSSRAPATSS